MGCSISSETQVGRRRDRYQGGAEGADGKKGKKECLLSPSTTGMDHYKKMTFYLESSEDDEEENNEGEESPRWAQARETTESFSSPTTQTDISPYGSGAFTPSAPVLNLPNSICAPLTTDANNQSSSSNENSNIEHETLNSPGGGCAQVSPCVSPGTKATGFATPPPNFVLGATENVISMEYEGSQSPRSQLGTSLSPRQLAISTSFSDTASVSTASHPGGATPVGWYSPRCRRIKVISRQSSIGSPRSALKRGNTPSQSVNYAQHPCSIPDRPDDDVSLVSEHSESALTQSSRSMSVSNNQVLPPMTPNSIGKRRVTFSWANDAVDAALKSSRSASLRRTSNSSLSYSLNSEDPLGGSRMSSSQ